MSSSSSSSNTPASMRGKADFAVCGHFTLGGGWPFVNSFPSGKACKNAAFLQFPEFSQIT
jgi:hypothetical protein